jgi:CheY-like chemotaxis protein
VEVEAMIRRVAAEELKRRQAITHDDSAAPVSRGSHTEDLRIYREFLQQVWSKGAPTEDEFRQVGLLRTALLVLKEEHSAIERDVRMNAYMIAFQHLAGSTNGTQQALLDLRKTYGISEEEHVRLAPRLPAAPQAARKRPIVLVIDDDDRLLEILSRVVEDAGFEAIALPTSDEAYALLRKLRPDLILCDINLETSTMGGFTFYERVQERHELQDVPFIFLTGLTDEVLVRTGKELGVDDYLTKPISEATLVSTLRGKMKRFRQLRNVFPKNAAA